MQFYQGLQMWKQKGIIAQPINYKTKASQVVKCILRETYIRKNRQYFQLKGVLLLDVEPICHLGRSYIQRMVM